MNRITETLTNSLQPVMAVIIYQNGNQIYIERRDIEKGRMQAGVPLTEKCLAGISEVISSTSSKMIHGSVPSFMLFADSRPGVEKYVWFRKPEKRMMFFSEKLGIPSGEIKLPGLIYMAKGKNLSVFAVKSKRKPGPSTRLFRAPFFNVDNSAGVCFGNAKIKDPEKLTFYSVVKYWEDKFWLSEFDHLLGENPIKGNLATITKQCIQTGSEFPLNELKPIKLKLKDLL